MSESSEPPFQLVSSRNKRPGRRERRAELHAERIRDQERRERMRLAAIERRKVEREEEWDAQPEGRKACFWCPNSLDGEFDIDFCMCIIENEEEVAKVWDAQTEAQKTCRLCSGHAYPMCRCLDKAVRL